MSTIDSISIAGIESCFQSCQRELHYGLCVPQALELRVRVVLRPDDSPSCARSRSHNARPTLSRCFLFRSFLNSRTCPRAELRQRDGEDAVPRHVAGGLLKDNFF